MSIDGMVLFFFGIPVLSAVGFLIALIYWIVLKRKNQREPGAVPPKKLAEAKHDAKICGIVALTFAALSAGIYWLLSAAVAHM